jgi:response regulator RpfG family c-di-GMP phosphodiesterase
MSTTPQDLPRILCVDDEARVVEAIVLHLRKNYQVSTALSGNEGLKTLKRMGGAAVVISDMRMPGMDGATFLNNVMHLYPDASRILLTGETGRDAAVSAVNKGHIFQFLTKPCTPDALKTAVEAGVVKYGLANTERAILKETLNGCVATLMEVLALIRPSAFGRASRLRRQVMEFAATLGCEDQWQLEAATLLSQIGHFCLPTGLLEKLRCGEKLTPQETILAGGAPHSASAVLRKVPRLEPVVQILTALTWTDEQVARLGDSTLGLCTRILGVVLDYDALVTQGHAADASVQMLRGQSARFGERLLEQFGAYIAAEPNNPDLRTIPLGALKPGMAFTQDVRTPDGTLLVARGFEVTEVFLEHARTFGPDLLNKSVRILVRSTP